MVWMTIAVAACPCFSQQDDNTSTTSDSTSTRNSTLHNVIADLRRDESEDSYPVGKPRTLRSLTHEFLQDQENIWTSPAHLRFADTEWFVPLAGFTAGLVVTDSSISNSISRSSLHIRRYRDLANAGIGAEAGIAGGLILWSAVSHDPHQRETGFLAGESAADALLVGEALKYMAGRERPGVGSGSGDFGKGGSSFPSAHALAAWSIAGVIAHEYPGPLTKILAYGLATAVSVSRVESRDHFPSDVAVGSALGWMIAQHVYSKHHDPELGGEEWRSFGDFVREPKDESPTHRGSPYVPLDSWVYPAFERLAGLGLLSTDLSGLRPWTRAECARLTNEAMDHLRESQSENEEGESIVNSLQREFRFEGEADTNGTSWFHLDSLYSRTEYISGPPILDGYHFAQTQINDFGRPYGEGWNSVDGFSASAAAGPWVAYIRGEYQTAPGSPALPLAAREDIQHIDFLPGTPPATPGPSTSQFQALDAYVGIMLSGWEVTFGRQSLWWGPGDGSPMMFSDNALPVTMFRVNRTVPFNLPGIFHRLGPVRTEFFLGQLQGQHFINGPQGQLGSFSESFSPQPMIQGQKINFKPTENLEFGFSRTVLFAGLGVPFNLHTLNKSLFSFGNGNPGTPQDPGDRRAGFDWSYRLPKLRDWLTFYGDAFSEDEITPVGKPWRSSFRSGLFLSHVPKIKKLDLRVEGVYTDVPTGKGLSGGFFYFNDRYLSGYTNAGNLMGSWIGRQGQGAQAWSNYWLAPNRRIQINFRHQKVSNAFIENGGTLTDFGVRADQAISRAITVGAEVQYERWFFPVIQPTPAVNVSSSIEIDFHPSVMFQHGGSRTSSAQLGERGNP